MSRNERRTARHCIYVGPTIMPTDTARRPDDRLKRSFSLARAAGNLEYRITNYLWENVMTTLAYASSEYYDERVRPYVSACVLRDDGARGISLELYSLSENCSYLNAIIC